MYFSEYYFLFFAGVAVLSSSFSSLMKQLSTTPVLVQQQFCRFLCAVVTQSDTLSKVGDDGVIKCEVGDATGLTGRWEKNGEEVNTDDERISVTSEFNGTTLIFSLRINAAGQSVLFSQLLSSRMLFFIFLM